MLASPAKRLSPTGEAGEMVDRIEKANNRVELLGQPKARHVLTHETAARDFAARLPEHGR